MNDLHGKRILLIAARYFGYEKEIKTRLTQMGAHVEYFDQRPSNSVMTKALIRINKNLLARTIDEYYEQIAFGLQSKTFDFVLFISPEAVTEKAIKTLKQALPKAKFLLYMWDSVQNKGKNVHDILPYFDARFSFDKIDCLNTHWDIVYRPLFFLNDYAAVRHTPAREFDLLFIGTVHSDRFRILRQLMEYCSRERRSYFFYMFFPSKILFYYRKLKDSSFRGASIDDFRFHALGKSEIISWFEKTVAIVDIQHPQQTGLTMRTIEVLGARRKLITTNKDIVHYDFYHPDNISLVDRDAVRIDEDFLKSPMYQLPDDIYGKYSIDGWINDLFFG